MTPLRYRDTGVDVQREEVALAGLLGWVRRTHGFRRGGEPGHCALGVGYFCNVVQAGANLGLAVASDGVGTKILVAQLAGRFDGLGVDLVAMNVNDVLCAGAEPVTLLDYVAVETLDPAMLEGLGRGLHDGAKEARVTVSGGEVAQVGALLRGAAPGRALELSATCVGVVALDRVVTGAHVQPGDVVVGLASSGIHANGLSLARRALLEVAGLGVGDVLPECGGHTVADELLTPTRIYVRPVLDLLNDSAVEVRALAHVTGDGLLNVARVDAPCGFVLDNLPPPPPVFDAVARRGGVPPEEMHLAFNMGVGFCVTVPPAQAHVVVETAARHGVAAWPLGRAVRDPDRTVHLPSRRLVGHPVARRFVPG